MLKSVYMACVNGFTALALLAGGTGIPSHGHAAPAQPSQSSQTHQYDLCARAEGLDEANPVLQTLRVKLELTQQGVAPDMLKFVQQDLIAKTVKPALGPVKIFVEDYDRKTCAAAGNNLLQLAFALDAKQVAEINNSTTRGELIIPALQALLPAAPPKILTNANDQANSASLRIFFATNRNATGSKKTAEAFGKKLAKLSYGEVQVQVKRQPKMKNLETTSIAKFDSVTDLKNFAVANQYTMLTHEAWLKEVQARASKFNKAGVLLFVHGYKNNFVDAAAIAGQFTYDMAFNGASVMFSWPSQNNFSDYKEDGELAQSSTAAMATLLADLTALQKEGPVYVVAHSMGNRVLLDGLKQFLKDSSADQTRSITEVVLAAPDVPQKDYKAKWGDNLADNGIYPTLYASKGDLAMNASVLYNQNEGPRLGQGGPDLLQTRYLVSIDASEMKGSLFSEHHAYFRDNHTVAKDLYGLLRERKKVEKRPNLKKLSDVHSSWLLQAKISPQELTFTQLLCPAKCSKTLKSSLQPFIGTKVQIGPNQFSGAVLDSLFDSCDGKIELRPQQQSRQQQLAELKKTIAPNHKFDAASLHLPEPLHSALVVCNREKDGKAGNVARIISLEEGRVLVLFEYLSVLELRKK